MFFFPEPRRDYTLIPLYRRYPKGPAESCQEIIADLVFFFFFFIFVFIAMTFISRGFRALDLFLRSISLFLI
jgi:hypothetical protein